MRNTLILSGIIAIVLLLSGCVAGTPPASTPVPSATAAPAASTPAPSAMAPTAPVETITISGTVVDKAGTPVPNALVGLWLGDVNTDTPESKQHANDSGFFSFSGLSPAHYQVTADIPGHHGFVDQNFDESTSIVVTMPDYSASAATPEPAGQASISPDLPHFSVTRIDATTVQVHLVSFGKATSVKGFYVKSPVITTPEVLAVDKPLGESETIEISDPNLRKPAHFVASSWVNGQYAVVVDTTV